MTAADNTCEHGWTWGQCCPKPWPSADRTAFTHGLELLRQMEDPVVDYCVVEWAGPCYLGGPWHYCSRLTEHIGDHGCECGENTPLVQPPPHLTPEEVQEIRDWIATPPTSHVDDLIYRALRELSEIRQYEDPRDDGSYD